MFRKSLFAALTLVLALAMTFPAFARDNHGYPGAVYIMSNNQNGNQVLIYDRSDDGTLTYSGEVSTGGLGSGIGNTVPPDPLGSQNSLLVSDDGQWLFAVNAGSNEISVFSVNANGLTLTDKVASGGNYPVSLTFFHRQLYVLNAGGDGNITGFHLNNNGRLSTISNSTRSLQAATPPDGSQPNILEAPGQVGFSPKGDFLIVTDKGGVSGNGRLLVFPVNKNGLPAEHPAVTHTANPVPFAFTFDRFGHPVVVDASAGTATSFSIKKDGSLDTLSTAVTGQAATCWIVNNTGYIITDNTGSGTISAFASSHNGSLTPVNTDGIVANTGSGSLPLDAAVSRNGQFVYSLTTGVGQIAAFKVNADGSLTSLGTVGGYSAISGFQGIAAR
jgi:6-phosphogluconolactonase